MPKVCAIYGYEFTRPFQYAGLRFLPRYSWVSDVHYKARDLGHYNLTGVVVLDTYDDQQIFCLEAVLSFIEHLDVFISDPSESDSSKYFSLFPEVARTAQRHKGGGAVLHQDTFFPTMRSDFICRAMDRLADDAFCQSTGWNTLFFKATVSFRQRNPYIEVSYFLLFSGLETYVRRTLAKPDDKDIGALISRRLRQLGFNIYSYRPTDLKRSADSYSRLRNALFHNSAFRATRRGKDGVVITYDLRDYYAHFMILVSLVVVKAIDFDHPRLRWDSWITMQT